MYVCVCVYVHVEFDLPLYRNSFCKEMEKELIQHWKRRVHPKMEVSSRNLLCSAAIISLLQCHLTPKPPRRATSVLSLRGWLGAGR